MAKDVLCTIGRKLLSQVGHKGWKPCSAASLRQLLLLLQVSVPYGAPTAGRVFLFAGFLKLWMMCLPFTPMAWFMYISGRVDLGFWAVVKMLPISLGLAALAKFIVDRKLHER